VQEQGEGSLQIHPLVDHLKKLQCIHLDLELQSLQRLQEQGKVLPLVLVQVLLLALAQVLAALAQQQLA
jgi:hypothetical protein